MGQPESKPESPAEPSKLASTSQPGMSDQRPQESRDTKNPLDVHRCAPSDESYSAYNKRSILQLWKLSKDPSHHEALSAVMKNRSFDLHISSRKKFGNIDNVSVFTIGFDKIHVIDVCITDVNHPDECERFSLCEIDYCDEKAYSLFAESLRALIKFCCHGRVNNVTFEPDTIRHNLEDFSDYMSSILSSQMNVVENVLPIKTGSAMEVDKVNGSALDCGVLLSVVTPRHLKLSVSISEVSICPDFLLIPGVASAQSIIIELDTRLKNSVKFDPFILKWRASSIITRTSGSWFKSEDVYPVCITPEGLSKFIEQWLTGKRVIERTHLEQRNYSELFHKSHNYRIQFVYFLHAQLSVLEATDKIDILKKLSEVARERLQSLDTERFNSRQDFVFDWNSRFIQVGRADGKLLAVVIRSSTLLHPFTLCDLNQMSIDIFPLN